MSLDAMKQALEALEEIADEVFSPYDNKLGGAILTLRSAIEQAEKPRQWQGLTDDELWVLWNSHTEQPFPEWFVDFKRAYEVIEAKLKEKNT